MVSMLVIAVSEVWQGTIEENSLTEDQG